MQKIYLIKKEMILYENKNMTIMDSITRRFHIKNLTVDKTFFTAVYC